MKKITEPAKQTPVFAKADICVLGGGCTGVFAAIRAARLGAKVIIVEKQNSFGGVATSAMVNIWHSVYNTTFDKQIIAGLTQETVERLKRREAVRTVKKNYSSGFVLNTEELKIELDEMVKEENVEPFLHTFYVAPYTDQNMLKGVIVENKSGRGAILASMFIDATGDGDLCHDLKIPYKESEHKQPPTTNAKINGWSSIDRVDISELFLKHGKEFGFPEGSQWGEYIPGAKDLYMLAGTRVYDANCVDGRSLTNSEIEGRRQVRAYMDLIRKYCPNQSISLASLPSNIGIRETRHVQCQYQLNENDVLYGKQFDDAIANGSYRIDIHHSDKPGITYRYLNGEEVYTRPGYPAEISHWRGPLKKDPTYYQIPYRSLVPDKYHNVLVAGRMLDVDNNAYAGVRVMVNMNQVGEAAGVAAYLSLHSNRAVQNVEIPKLRKILAQGGSIII